MALSSSQKVLLKKTRHALATAQDVLNELLDAWPDVESDTDRPDFMKLETDLDYIISECEELEK